MKLFNLDGDLVKVDIRSSSYPIKMKSKSIGQGRLGDKLLELYPYDVILEEFTIPNTQFKIDFFLPHRKLIYEFDGKQHGEYSAFFHGDRNKGNFGKQKNHDAIKEQWAEINGFKVIRVRSDKEINELQSGR